MKKFFVLFPILCFCILAFYGCNDEDETEQSEVALTLSTDFLKQTVWKGRLDYPDYFPKPTDYFVVGIQFTDEESGVCEIAKYESDYEMVNRKYLFSYRIEDKKLVISCEFDVIDDEWFSVECSQGEMPRIMLKSRLYSTNEKEIKTLTLDKVY